MAYRKKIILSLILVVLASLISYGVEAYQGMSRLNDKVIRLHVIANSNTFEDQQLKLKVRNNIIDNFNDEFQLISSKDKSQEKIISKINEIRDEASDIIKADGYNYDVNVYYGNYNFPRKQYDDIVLPQGSYDALRIEIGKAEGDNWWCVMFPPLCFLDFGNTESSEPVFDIDTERKLEEVLTKEEIEAIKTKRGLEDIKLKSKIFEFIEKGKVENTGVYAENKDKIYASSSNRINDR